MKLLLSFIFLLNISCSLKKEYTLLEICNVESTVKIKDSIIIKTIDKFIESQYVKFREELIYLDIKNNFDTKFRTILSLTPAVFNVEKTNKSLINNQKKHPNYFIYRNNIFVIESKIENYFEKNENIKTLEIFYKKKDNEMLYALTHYENFVYEIYDDGYIKEISKLF